MDPALSSRRRALGLMAVLAVLPFLVFWPVVAGSATLARGDFLEQNYPLRHFAVQSWSSGTLPLWNPYINGGQPGLADFLTGTLYPPTLLTGLLTLPWGFPIHAMELGVLVHLSLAGIFTFLFAREILGSDVGAAAAGVVYSLGGFATSYPMEQNHILESATWLPLILLFLELAFRRGRILYYVGAGLWLGLALLANHPQTVLYTAFGFGLFWLWRFAGSRDRMHLAGLACMGLTTAAIYLPQLVPSLEMLSESNRASMTYAASAAGMAPSELWAALAPVHGGNAGMYVGLLALLLAPLAIGLRRARPQMVFWAAIALLAVLFALGGSGPIFPALHTLIPGLGLMRQQERALVVYSLAMALLAGGGLAALTESIRSRRIAAAGGALAATGAAAWWVAGPALPVAVAAVLPRALPYLLAGAAVLAFVAVTRRGHRGAAWLLLVLLLADLWTAPTHTAVAEGPATVPAPDAITATLAKASAQGPAFRISSEGLLPGDGNTGLFFRLEDTVGSTTMTLSSFTQLIAEVPEYQWWRLLNVRYIVTKRELTHGALALEQQQGDLRLYEFYDRLPRARMVHRVESVDSPDEALAFVAAPDFAADRQAAVEGGPGLMGTPAPTNVRFRQLTPVTMRLLLQTGEPGYVLISQNYYPGWLALVDGSLEPVYRANGWQPAIYLERGAHSILFFYIPFALLLGLVLSLASVAGLLILLRRAPATAPACP